MVGIEPTIYYLSVCVYLLTAIIFPILYCKNTIYFLIISFTRLLFRL